MSNETDETAEQQLVSQCVAFMWNRLQERHSPDAIREMQWSMSVDTLRYMVGMSLNGAEMAGFRVVSVADLAALLTGQAAHENALVGRHEDSWFTDSGVLIDYDAYTAACDRIRALIGGE